MTRVRPSWCLIDAFQNLATLCQRAFATNPRDAEAPKAALKSIANILLLHKEARQRFVETGFANAVADRLKVCGQPGVLEYALTLVRSMETIVRQNSSALVYCSF